MPADARRRSFDLPEQAVKLGALDWGGAGPVVLLHHANGFCAATWGLVARELRPQYRLIAIDVRGHGRSSKPEGIDAYDWHRLLDDLLGVAAQLADECGAPLALAAGNSFGGTLSACAAARRPELFQRVALLDPVIRPSAGLLAAHGLVPPGAALDTPNQIAEQARRRRALWPSRDAARSAWQDKPIFAGWDPRAFDLYLEHGLRERPDGRVELCCPPEVEAAIFEQSGSLDLFDYAERVRAPSLVVRASGGFLPPALFEALAEALPKGRLVESPAGHLLPLEDPKGTAELLRSFADEPL
jgi:pimeloyl-ACP methyl ester carboxylesterase